MYPFYSLFALHCLLFHLILNSFPSFFLILLPLAGDLIALAMSQVLVNLITLTCAVKQKYNSNSTKAITTKIALVGLRTLHVLKTKVAPLEASLLSRGWQDPKLDNPLPTPAEVVHDNFVTITPINL